MTKKIGISAFLLIIAAAAYLTNRGGTPTHNAGTNHPMISPDSESGTAMSDTPNSSPESASPGNVMVDDTDGIADRPRVDSARILGDGPISSQLREANSLDLAFEAEPRDSEWALPLESKVFEHLMKLEMPLISVDAQCRSQTCRIIMVHPNSLTSTPIINDRVNDVRSQTAAILTDNRGEIQRRTIIIEADPRTQISTTKVYFHRTGEFGSSTLIRVPITQDNFTDRPPGDRTPGIDGTAGGQIDDR